MTTKHLNYKFFILALTPLMGLTLSLCFLFIHRVGVWLSLFTALFSLFDAIILLCSEPVFYCIKPDEISIICSFKRYIIPYNQIHHIELMYDVWFKFLFIQDYVIFFNRNTSIPNRCTRILNYHRTKTLIEKYYHSKVYV